MAYIALKPCRFAGQAFKIGEAIPEGVIHSGMAENLVKMQVIASANGEAPTGTSTASESVKISAGDMTLEISKDSLQLIFDALTANVENAEKIVKKMTDGDALILLHMSDSRKSIKAAAEDRAKAINEVGEA